MPLLDLSRNPRIPHLLQLLSETSRITDPLELQKSFGAGIRRLYQTAGYISLSTRDLPPGWYRITRVLLDHLPSPDWADNWKIGNTLPLRTGGFLGEVVRDDSPKLFHHLRLTDDPVMGDDLAPLGSAMAFPLFDAGHALNWGIAFRTDPEGFTERDMEDQLMRGNLVGGMVRNLVNVRRINELNARLQQQLVQVAQIQRSLIPQRLPSVPGLSLAASYVTSNEAGGDYYDFFDMGKGRWGVLIADVSGHGAGAATVMAMLQTILHDYQDRDRGPGAMLAHANRGLLTKNLDGSFVTAYMGVFDPDRRRITFANAGHLNPAVRAPRDHAVRELTGDGGPPLGVLDDAEYPAANAPLHPGETLVLYTDGITEAFSPPPHNEMFGFNRLHDAIRSSPPDPANVIDAIHSGVFEHTQSLDRADDQTIVAVHVNP